VDNLPDDVEAYLAQRLDDVLPVDVLGILRRVAALAGRKGWSIYLVGGYVRDLFLKIPDYDVDISVEGDAVTLASLLASESNLPRETHNEFGTARLDLTPELHLDFVTARKESYPTPGALPVVEAGSIQDDLARRDFTVNAMAVGIQPEGTGPVLDPHGGLEDLRARLIRVLHDKSFRDDPTRIFRAVKLAHRLGFKIEKGTLELILQAVRDGALSTVSIDRITNELLLILEEPNADAMLAELEKLGVLRAIHPGLSWPYEPGRFKPSGNLKPAERRDAYLAAIAAEYADDPAEAEALARFLRLPSSLVRLMKDAATLARVWPQLGEELPASQVYNLLNGLNDKALRAYSHLPELSLDKVAWRHLNNYLVVLQHMRTELTGDYLRELGIPPGPLYKEILDELFRAKLDREVKSREDEERFVRERLHDKGLL
jgi:tRNA nucleotidyltransferase (CCA-adding enzyme)